MDLWVSLLGDYLGVINKMSNENLFFTGKTPQEIRANIGKVNDNNALNIAGLEPGRGQVYQAARAGGYFEQALSKPGAEEKRAVNLQRAQEKMKEEVAKGTIDTSNPITFYDKMSKILLDSGATDEAAQASAMAEGMRIKRGNLKAKVDRAIGESNKSNNPIDKLYDGLANAVRNNDKPRVEGLKIAINNALEDEDSAATIVLHILKEEENRINKFNKGKSEDKQLRFNPRNFSEVAKVTIQQIQSVHGKSAFMGALYNKLNKKFKKDPEKADNIVSLTRDKNGKLQVK